MVERVSISATLSQVRCGRTTLIFHLVLHLTNLVNQLSLTHLHVLEFRT